MRYLGRRKGIVLIVVMGVLFIMSLLAVTFATLQFTERRVSSNYVDTVRAKLAAQSGLQDAEVRLRDIFPFRYLDVTRPRAWKYWGDDTTETEEPNNSTNAERVENAVNPSFALEDEVVQNPNDPIVKPMNLVIEGKNRGLSGVYESGTYGNYGDHYVLRVNDLSGSIYINDGLKHGPTGSVSQNLKRILNELGSLSTVGIEALGDKILNGRPKAGYQHPQEILRALAYDENAFRRVRYFLTSHAWVDEDVALPVPLSPRHADRIKQETGVDYTRSGVYRLGWGITAVGNLDKEKWNIQLETAPPLKTAAERAEGDDQDIRLYGLDVLNPQWIEIVSRAPVNINSAPQEVLTALLTNLKGVFVSDRRRNNPCWQGDAYMSFKRKYTYSIEGSETVPAEGDEYGLLRETMQIQRPSEGTRVQGEIYADQIAQEIVACRMKKISPFNPQFTYADKPWAGIFKSWDQFNKFVDHLVYIDPSVNTSGIETVGLLRESRDEVATDYSSDPADYENPTGYTSKQVISEMNRLQGSRAMADVLKANFNPNLHLNEMNPDENLFALVDKTDLMVNSTEFCFLPTGFFEVESVGRVIRPSSGKDCRMGDNQLVAQAKVSAIYKFYDIYRETTQKQFYAGDWGQKDGGTPLETNNGRKLEVGPEPDNGIFPGNLGNKSGPPDNEWGGYVALPTVGGEFHSSTGFKPKNTLWKSLALAGAPHLQGDSMHVHFTYDADAHYHAMEPQDTTRKEIGSRNDLPHDKTVNFPDWPESCPGVPPKPSGYDKDRGDPGPYTPAYGEILAGVSKHRMARSFRLTTGVGATNPSIYNYAPSDLRIDGLYSERHSAPCYYTHYGPEQLQAPAPPAPGEPPAPSKTHLWDFTHTVARGMVSFWAKPSFFPEFTGKVRSIWNLSRYHGSCPYGVNVFPFALWFFPSHYNTAESEASNFPANDPITGGDEETPNLQNATNCPRYWTDNIGRFRPMSMAYGAMAWHESKLMGYAFGNISRSINHHGHPDDMTQNTLLKAHKWINFGFTFSLAGVAEYPGDPRDISQLYINGSTFHVPWVLRNKHDSPSTAASMMQRFSPTHTYMGGLEMHDTTGNSVNGSGTGDWNHMRLGAPSRISTMSDNFGANMSYRGNYAADCTFDEFYVWANQAALGTIEGTIEPKLLWSRGRYYNGVGGGYTGMAAPKFTSQAFELKTSLTRAVPPCSTSAQPDTPSSGSAPPPPPSTVVSLPALGAGVRVLGIQWTWMGEPLDEKVTPFNAWDGNPVLYDYSGTDDGSPGVDVKPLVKVGLIDGGSRTYGPFEDFSFSPVLGPDGGIPVIQNPTQLQYVAYFELGNANDASVFLATPVLDDVTVYWDDNQTHLLSYVYDNRSF